jgi:hypothetical protein
MLLVFGAAAGAIWVAGIHLSNQTDVLFAVATSG